MPFCDRYDVIFREVNQRIVISFCVNVWCSMLNDPTISIQNMLDPFFVQKELRKLIQSVTLSVFVDPCTGRQKALFLYTLPSFQQLSPNNPFVQISIKLLLIPQIPLLFFINPFFNKHLNIQKCVMSSFNIPYIIIAPRQINLAKTYLFL